MPNFKIPKPSPALFISCLSLFVALSGVGYAAVVLPKNSVGTAQLKAGAVRTADVQANAITSGKVMNGSLLGVDFAAGQLQALAGTERVTSVSAMNSDESKHLILGCPAPKKIIGGGGATLTGPYLNSLGDVFLKTSRPFGDDAWFVVAEEAGSFDEPWTLQGWAVCANLG